MAVMGNKTINLNLICYMERGERWVETDHEYVENLQRFFRHKLKVHSLKLDESVKLECPALELDDEYIKVYGANVSLGRLTAENFKDFIRRFCSLSYEWKIWISCERFVFSTVLNGDNFETHQRVVAKYFNLGTIVNMNDFVYHYRSNYVEDDRTVSPDDLFIIFEHSLNEVHVHFRVETVAKQGTKKSDYVVYDSWRYKIVFKYDSINSLQLVAHRDSLSVYFFLSCTPILYALEEDTNPYRTKDKEEMTNEYIPPNAIWIRVLRFPGVNTYVFGKCNVLQVCLNELEEHSEAKDLSCPWSAVSVIQKFKTVGAYFTAMRSRYFTEPYPLRPRLNDPKAFDVLYALESVQSPSFQFLNDLDFHGDTSQFERKFRDFILQDAEALEEALYDLAANLQLFSISRVFPTFLKYYERQRSDKLKKTREVFGGTTKIKRAILTPTKLIILRPFPFIDSRFVRQSDPDYLLRVVLRDDDSRKFTFSLSNVPTKAKRDFFEECLRDNLTNGIRIGDRIFEFVGSSQSQLRDNGLLMYAKDSEGRTAEQLRNSLGTIRELNVSKYVARIGLMLSQAVSYVPADDAIIKFNEVDITNPDAKHPKSKEPYVFSDGVGKVSVPFAQKICEQLRKDKLLAEDKEMPSAYQIRLGGCKGMVVLDPTLTDYDLVLRKSMQKFESDDKHLGVLKVSDLRAVYLNKPLVTLLEQLGTNSQVFREMQFGVLKNIHNCFISEASAVEILQSYSSMHSLIKYKDLVQNGVRILNEPFFRFSLDIVAKKSTQKLKDKARIQIPMDFGRTMFGVVDETRTLNYGEIFVQPTNREDPSKTEPLKRIILVSKFPCMHPGDVRFFKAVDVKALDHIKDCIVFPAKGPRPHPNEMAGSDLDGDEYAVIWYEPLHYPRRNQYEPMLYPDYPATKLDHAVTMDDITAFYIRFIQDYSVGVIASAHLAWADCLHDGIFSKKCMKLAEMYSVSLDFAKTGLNCQLDKDERVRNYPDFMEKFAQKSSYLSKRALGQLHRQICVFELMFNENISTDIKAEPTRLFDHPHKDMFQKEAVQAYKEYVHYISHLQRFFGIESEFSIVTGAYTKSHNETTMQDKFSDSQRAVGKSVSNVFRILRESFENQLSQVTTLDLEEARLAKASAYYFSTYEINKSSETPYYGLPWVVWEQLNILAARNKQEEPNYEASKSRKQYFAQLIDNELGVSSNTPSATEKRVDMVKRILSSWVSDQVVLQLGSHQSEHVIGTRLTEMVEQQAVFYRQNKTQSVSVGGMLLSIFFDLMSKEFTPDFVKESASKLFKYSLGFTALLTLSRLYRMQSISHILPQKTTILTSSIHLVCTRSFNLSFKNNDELFHFIVKNEKVFAQVMKTMTTTSEIKGRWVSRGGGERQFHFYVLTAFGTAAQLYSLSHLLSKLIFSRGRNFLALIERAVAGR